MKIGIYHQRVAWNSVGGIAVFLQQMAIQLSEKHDVTVYSSADEATVPELASSNVDVVRVDRSRTMSLLRPINYFVPDGLYSAVAFFLAARSDGTIDRINEHEDVLITGLEDDSFIVSRAVDTPTVYEYHINLGNVGFGTWLHDKVSDPAVRLANSETTARTIERELSITVDGIVTPGIDLAEFEAPERNRFDDDTDHVVTVARQHREKGIIELIEALATLSPVPTLHLVGTGKHSDQFAERAADLGIATQLRQHGRVPRDILPDMYASADVSCNPSHHESWCMTNMEAMAAGTPVVTSNLPAIREYAEDGKNCILVEPKSINDIADAIESILRDDDLANRLRDGGKATAHEYSWARQAEQLEKYLRQAVA
jgi:glycosyltransferase involved in cell wall biosynthesis